MTLIIWQTKISFYLQKDLLSLNEINHVIVLRIGVLADYADASGKWVIRLWDRTNMYIIKPVIRSICGSSAYLEIFSLPK